VKISALALLKMAMHAKSGGNLEIMGMLQGKIIGDTFIIVGACSVRHSHAAVLHISPHAHAHALVHAHMHMHMHLCMLHPPASCRCHVACMHAWVEHGRVARQSTTCLCVNLNSVSVVQTRTRCRWRARRRASTRRRRPTSTSWTLARPTRWARPSGTLNSMLLKKPLTLGFFIRL